jgi:hypothetical protein
MAVICSEEARQALDLITRRSQPEVSAVHVIEVSWPLQSCPIETVLSYQRDLTLLEKYTLRAFNEISGVNAADIADRLGLKEPELIEETLQTLHNSGAIESSITPDEKEPSGNLKEKLRLIEEKLATNSYRGIVLRNMRRKADILRERIRKKESPRGGNISEKINHKIERLKLFTAKVTQRGLEHLRDGTITEPAKTEVFDLVRSIPDGKVMTTKGHEFSRKNLGREDHWPLLKNPVSRCKPPSEEEVQEALQLVGELEGELVIQSLKPQTDVKDLVYLGVCITLAVSHEDDTCRFFAHRHGTGKRLAWIENTIAADAGLVSSILQQFKKVMPPPIKAKPAPPSMSHPLVHLNRLLTAEVESGSKSMVVLKYHKKLIELVDSSSESLERLLETRTTVTLLKNSKEWSLESDEVPLRFTLPLRESTLPSGSIATSRGVIHLGTVVIKSRNSKNTIELPVLRFSQDLGRVNVSRIDQRLRSEINSRACFLLTRNEADFALWMDEQVKPLRDLEKVSSVIDAAEKLVSGTGHDIAFVFFNSLFSSRKDFFKGDKLQSCMKLVETLSRHDRIEQGGWPYIEPHIQQAALESVFAGDGATDALESWQKHQTLKKPLPWEDAARLESALFGHCNSTRFEVNRQFETVIGKMASRRKLSTEDIATALKELEQAKVIDRHVRKQADVVRKERNRFTHEGGVSADQVHTLRAIAIIRELASVGTIPTDPRWAKQSGQKWSQTLTSKAVVDYLKIASRLIREAQSGGRHCHGEIWVSAVKNRMPKRFDAVPLDIIEALQKAPACDSGQTFRDLTQTILNQSVERWVKTLPAPDSLMIPDTVRKMISRLEKLGLDDAEQHIAKSVIHRVPLPTNVSLLEEELIASTSIPDVLAPDLRTRWSRAVTDKAFTVTLDEIAVIKADSLAVLGSNGKTRLFKKGLDASIAGVEKGDVSGVKGVCNTIELLMKKEAWIKPVTGADGLISDRVYQRIRAGEDIIMAGRKVNRLMPIVNPERLPKTHARFEAIVSRGRKDSKKEERK